MPDAWDDDWIAKADSSTSKPHSTPSAAKISKAERRAKQAEFNRQLWEDAEDPKDNFFLKSRDIVPLKSEFKPAMKVLSRKPIAKSAGSTDPATGMGRLSIDDDDDDDDDEAKKNTLTLEERQEKAQREREEKQKKYEEVRQKLFGTDDASTSSTASASPARNNGNSRNQSRNKVAKDSRPSSAASNRNRQLYDPNDTGKPGTSSVLKKEANNTPNEIQPIRDPRNPDGSGRGGFGFAPRGGRAS